jgi:hypothetical protein
MFDKVDCDGLTCAYLTNPPVDGVRLVVRHETYQADPTTVYVRFQSGHFGVWHRYNAADVEVARRRAELAVAS